MKALMQSRYVSWMAVRPLPFGDKIFMPGEKVPQALLEPMRDPEVLVRTNRIAAVAKDMNKVPRYLRKQVTDEEEMRAKILAPKGASQIGPIFPTHLLPRDEEPTEVPDDQEPQEPTGEPEGVPGETPAVDWQPEPVSEVPDEVPVADPSPEPADDGQGDQGPVEAPAELTQEVSGEEPAAPESPEGVPDAGEPAPEVPEGAPADEPPAPVEEPHGE